MRIGLVSRSQTAEQTGLSTYDVGLSRALSGLGNVEVILSHPRMLEPPGASQLRRLLGWDLERFFQTYPVYPIRSNADLIHLTSQTLATALWNKPPQPTVITVQDIFPFLFRDNLRLGMYAHPIHRAFDLAAMRLLGRASAIIAISDAVRDDLLLYLGLNSSRVTVVPHAVDHDVFHSLDIPHDFWSRYHLDHQQRFVLHVSSDDPRKDIGTLLHAWQIVSREVPDVQLLKVGRTQFPRERQRLVALTAELELDRTVRFLDSVPLTDLVYFYNACSVFAFPSLAEGFGFPVLEAMACGAPVVCTDIGALRGLVGTAGKRVSLDSPRQLADALLDVLSNASLGAQMRAAGLERAAQFTWTRTAEATLQVYRDILGNY